MKNVCHSKNIVNHLFACFTKLALSQDISNRLWAQHASTANGVAERTIRTIVEKARCMLAESNLNKRYWGEAVLTAIYLKNRSPTMAISQQVPEQVWTGKAVDLSHLKVFGSKAQVLIKDGSLKKFDPKTRELIFLGYSEDQKGFKFADVKNNPRRIIVARDAVFDERLPNQSEDNMDFLGPTNKSPTKLPVVDVPEEFFVVPITGGTTGAMETEEEVPSQSVLAPATGSTTPENVVVESEEFHDTMDSISDSDRSEEREAEPAVEGPRYPQRTRVPNRLEDFEYNFFSVHDPVSVQDALDRGDKDLWLDAMKQEYNSLIENGTWELVDRPRGANVVKCKWLFKLKIGADETVQRHKARLVAKGYSQKWGEDYSETFAPVVKLSSVRLLLALSAEIGLTVHHIDVTTAFLNGDLAEDLYMEQPEAFITRGKEGKVCKLKKAIYGLKQAARCWNVKVHDLHVLDSHIIEIGFTRSKYDPCVYLKKVKSKFLAIALYVDDFYIFGHDIDEIQAVKTKIGDAFKIKDLGLAKDCLGMELTQRKGEVELNQINFIKKVLRKYKMEDCKVVATPTETNLRLEKGDPTGDMSYQEIVGSLMYLSCGTRPDITFIVSYLSQFNSCWNSTHMAALKRVLRYLKGTVDHKLVYKKTGNPLVAYADADWGANADGHSFTGYMVALGGAAVSWQTRKQRCVALSTAEAEYVAICEAAKEASGAALDKNMLAICMGIVRVIFTVIGCILCRRCGRRILTFISALGCGITMIILAVYMYFVKYWKFNHLPLQHTWIPIVCIFIFVIACTLGYLIVPWVMIGEVYPTQVRGIVGGMTTCVAHMSVFSVVKTFPFLKATLNDYGVFGLYGTMSICAIAFFYFFLPETKGRSLQEIEDYFSGRTKSLTRRNTLTGA